jgi:hypothetical protein
VILRDQFLALGFALDLRGLFGGAEIGGKGRCRRRSRIGRQVFGAAGGTLCILALDAVLVGSLEQLIGCQRFVAGAVVAAGKHACVRKRRRFRRR